VQVTRATGIHQLVKCNDTLGLAVFNGMVAPGKLREGAF
jgi:hypothetical protein